jgi:hypothetical protein
MSIFGWLIVIAAVITAYVFYRRSTAPPPSGTAAASAAPNRAIALGAAIVAVGLATYLFAAAPPSAADLTPTFTEVFSSDPTNKRWVFNNPGQVGWDQQGGRLLAKMKVGEGWYGVVPVDWSGDVFRAEWDITILKRDADPQNAGPGAVAAVGMYDGTISNIDDTDHVGGGSIIAAFGDTVRLRISDVNQLVKSATGMKVEIGKPYHAVLTYDRHGNVATLQVVEREGNRSIANLRLEDLRDLSSSIAWFGVSMKGFSRNKTKRARGATVDGLFIDAAIDNVSYAQP